MKPGQVLLAGALLLASLACSCGPYRGTKISSEPLEVEENLVYLDAALTTQIPCEKLSAEQLPTGRLRVRAMRVQFLGRPKNGAGAAQPEAGGSATQEAGVEAADGKDDPMPF